MGCLPLKNNRAQFTVTVPYPGTKMFEDLDQQGKIRTYNWKKYNTWSGWQDSEDIPVIPDGRTATLFF